MNYTYSKHALDVIKAREIKKAWIEFTISNHALKNVKSPYEINLYAIIQENENRCLKVVINPETMIIITAYFDRNMRKKGCK